MFITKNNYDKKLKKYEDRDVDLSDKFLDMLQNIDEKEISLISVGNSISAGYSKCDEIIPFLKRSELYNASGDNISYSSFARVRRNEEKNIVRWYLNNLTDETLGELNIKDIAAKKDKYAINWSSDIPNSYKDLYLDTPTGLQELNQKGENNVIIYNGLTGVFTNYFRYGSKKEKLKVLTAFKEDLANFKLFLNLVYIENPTTQIYVVGLPNIMSTGIISVLDRQIKNITDQFPNAVFVKGVVRNSFFYLENQQEFDVHYSQPEYLHLWNNLTQAMIMNYSNLKLRLKLLNELRNYSSEMERECTLSKGDYKTTDKLIENEISKLTIEYLKYSNLQKELEIVAKYYNDNYLSTFSCSPREKVLSKLESYKSL